MQHRRSSKWYQAGYIGHTHNNAQDVHSDTDVLCCACRPSLTSSGSMQSVQHWCSPESRPSNALVRLSWSKKILSTSSSFLRQSLCPHPFWGSTMWILGTLGDPYCSEISILGLTWKADLLWSVPMVSFTLCHTLCSVPIEQLRSRRARSCGMLQPVQMSVHDVCDFQCCSQQCHTLSLCGAACAARWHCME